MEDPALWIALRDTPSLDRRGARELLRAFRAPEAIFGRAPAELMPHCSEAAAQWLARDPRLGPARAELERARGAGLAVLVQGLPSFPPLLLEISDPPVVLYAKGELPEGLFVSIVGSRRPTARGRETARLFASRLAQAGLHVVSGLAYGIDAAAHAGALERGGRTVAILAGGLDSPGPSGNLPLARRILESGGAWLSEHPLGVAARPAHFPDRNRLISGMSRATLIVEARERSGTLWTARHALDQGRDVLVVPGPIDEEACSGSNRLLLEGGKPVLEPRDVLPLAFGRLDVEPLLPQPLSPGAPEGEALTVLRRVEAAPCAADDLVKELGLGAARVAALLVELELDGWVRREGRRISAPRANRAGRA